MPIASATTLPGGFQETLIFDGLTAPTGVAFSSDGRVFVAEKSGQILVYSRLDDTSPTLFADLSTNVHNFWDRGLLGLALDPGFPEAPYVYVLYTHDAEIGGQAPRWGTPGVLSDPCPTPPGPLDDGCVVSGRLSRLHAAGDVMTGPEQVLVEGWCQQYPSHSVGDIKFDADGALYASAGEGASWVFADHGQQGNACGDPPNEGGALRSQDLRSNGDPVALNGSIIRVDPATGAPWPTNPLILDPDESARRIVAHGFRNPFRFAVRPGTSELWVGDVGWDTVDEVNRLSVSPVGVRNFGWPCYEGAEPEHQFDALDLALCEGLYADPAATVAPSFAYGFQAGGFPCTDGGMTIAGLAFYKGTSYPGYGGSLFLADYSRRCIWLMRPGPDGVPDPNRREVFASHAEWPVDLEVGPGGDLFYVDINAGAVRRIRHTAGNASPTAFVTATPTSGRAPLTVELDAGASTDTDGERLAYAWDLDADGAFDDGSDQVVMHTYSTRGRYEPRVRVTDSLGESSTASVIVNVDNTPPVATMDTPEAGSTWSVGDELVFSGAALDQDDGALPSSALRWRLVLQHCPSACHSHIVQTWDGVASGTFVAPDHDYPSHLELELTATDSDGTTHTVSRRLDPETVQLTFATSPGGLEVVFGGHQAAGPFARTVIVGSRTTLTAPTPQSSGGHLFHFDGWSHGGPRSQDLVAPAVATTYTASFSVAPVANADTASVNEDGQLTQSAPGVLGNDTDPDTATLSAELVQTTAHGTLTLSSDGSYTYTPDANFNGTDSFTYRATDGVRDSGVATATIQVVAVNDAPIANADTYATSEDAVLNVTPALGVLANDSDVETANLTAVKLTGPAHGILVLNSDGSLSYTPDANFNGTDSFTYRATDGALDSNTVIVAFTVAAVNDAPTGTPDAYTATENATLNVPSSLGVLANDSDVETPDLVAAKLTDPANGAVSIDSDGAFSYIPNPNFNGTDSFTYKATDGALDSDPVTVTISVTGVDDAPIANADAYAATEDLALNVSPALGVLANDSDAEGASLSALKLTNPGNGIVSLNPDGSFTYAPYANFNGTDSFTYQASDGALDSNAVTVTITVAAVNDAPTSSADAYSATEDATLNVPGAVGVLANDSDVESPDLVAAKLTDPANGSVSLDPDGSFSYSPKPNFSGTDSFTYEANDGAIGSGPVMVTITVAAVNDAPTASADAYAATEDETLNVSRSLGVLANDSDVETANLTAAKLTDPAYGTITLDPDGSFTYTPSPNFSGTDSFTYEASDGALDSNTVAVTITVAAVNDAPTASADAYSATEDATLNVPHAVGVLANDGDVESPNLAAAKLTDPANGTVSLSSDGSFSYTPNPNFNGTDSFTYRANDGANDSAPATVTISVLGVNDAPTANGDAYATTEDASLDVTRSLGVLANDSDVDTANIAAAKLINPANGSVTLSSDGSFSYSPNANFNGTDSFTYKANDGALDSSAVTVTIAVAAVNDPPLANGDAYSTRQFADLMVPAPGVLANDADVEGSSLQAKLVAAPASGILDLRADGSFSYWAGAASAPNVTFSYRVSDGTADSNVATVVIRVAGTTRPPRAVRCVVPRLIGRTVPRARRMLRAAHCRLGRVRHVSAATPAGRIRSQSPRAGRRLPNRAKVAVVVSRGRRG